MRAIAWLRRNRLEAGWAVFAAVNWVAMVQWPSWETIPFHFVWISLTLLFGFRVWSPRATYAVLSVVILATGASILGDAFDGLQLWGELFEVPLMSAMFLAMVWHARRRQAALSELRAVAEMRASLLERQERFLHDASHELRTPVTIARGHLELLEREHPGMPELEVALDELARIERIVGRLLLLAKTEQQSFVLEEIDLEEFLSDVFMRWSEVAPRAWRLDVDLAGRLYADPDGLREALDALLENAVKYTEAGDRIELEARAEGAGMLIEVSDSGCGVPDEALSRIFDRWARADSARTRERGGAGLGLAIVSAVARAHGGGCSVHPLADGTAFRLHLPVRTAPEAAPAATPVLGEGEGTGAAAGLALS
ncbi:MAG TPA: HAMP domain-containing sensor histidine kinase [Gaiellaceae bacterium]|jgi:signal transduction histidine kinase|nr:HAMP domain-containing sensor histidine kinase [Gaiellaceae bacterium]